MSRTGVLPGAIEYRASVELVSGTFHDIVLEYREKDGAANIQVGLFFLRILLIKLTALLGYLLLRLFLQLQLTAFPSLIDPPSFLAPSTRAVHVEQLQYRPGGGSRIRPFLHHSYLWITLQHLRRARGGRVPLHRRLRGGCGKCFCRSARIIYHPGEGMCAQDVRETRRYVLLCARHTS